MANRSSRHLLTVSLLITVVMLALSLPAHLGGQGLGNQQGDDRDDDRDNGGEQRRPKLPLPLATGQLVTPTAMRAAFQQYLNPGLPDHPNFVAGEAVRSQLSPDGTTLAIICAGM